MGEENYEKTNSGIIINGKGNFKISGGIKNNVTITHNAPASDAAVLQDLADAQKKLADLAPKIADSIGELKTAIEKKDQKTTKQKIAELTSGTAAEILKSVAGAAAVHFLGLG